MSKDDDQGPIPYDTQHVIALTIAFATLIDQLAASNLVNRKDLAESLTKSASSMSGYAAAQSHLSLIARTVAGS